ncbi:MAG: histidine kinase, partial [Methylococcaceae bacterium]|nr:histidine kinase [Methylococcaceae bacterium]
VVLAQLHSKIGQKDNKAYPAISSIPAASKLNDATLSPEHSLAILHDAKGKINNALKAFSQ